MTYSVELSEHDLAIIGAALGRMPYADVADLIRRISEQVKDAPHE